MQQAVQLLKRVPTFNLNSDIDIQTAKSYHIPEIASLNRAWFKDNLNQHEHGFLSVCYPIPHLEEIIQVRDALVFLVDKKVEGYILVNTVIDLPHTSRIREEHLNLSQKEPTNRIAYSYQILLNGPLQGCGFFSIAQHACRAHFKMKYEFLVSTINKINHRSMLAHKKLGWQIFETAENYNIIEMAL
jgi:hypothetical protein